MQTFNIYINVSPRQDVNRGECVLVYFPYHEKMITLIKAVPSAMWCPEFKCWELRKCMCKVFAHTVKRYRAQLNIEPMYHIQEGIFDNSDSEFDFSSVPPLKSNLFPYQIDAVKFGVKNKRFILGDEPGCLSGESEVCVQHTGKPETQYIKLSRLFEKCLIDDNYLKTLKIKSLMNGRFAYIPVHDIVYSGIQETVRVVTEHSVIELTSDHLVLTESGWKEAGKLTVGDYVIHDGVESACIRCGSNENLITYPYSKFKGYCKKCMYLLREGKFAKEDEILRSVDKDGYVHVYGKKYRQYPGYTASNGILEHHLVIYEHTGKVIDTSIEVVHHKDHNRQNNSIDNLEVMSIANHIRIHVDTYTSNLPQNSSDFVHRKCKEIIYAPQKSKVVSVEVAKVQSVYDIKLQGDIHNFVANNIVVHNCGKTLEIIGIFHYLRCTQGLKKALIICGINGNKYNWLEEVEKHSNYKAHVIGSRIGKRSGKVNPGGLPETIEDLRNPPDVDFLIINIEKLRGGRVKRKRGQRKTIKEFPVVELIQNLIYQGEIGLVAFDECHKAKNPSSAQTQALMWINCSRQIDMTGTLIMNSPLDLYVPFKWMGWECRDYWYFTNRYAIKDTWGSIVGYQNAQELVDILSVYQLRRLKKDVLKFLPEKIHINRYIELTDEEWRCYKAVQLGLFNMLDGMESNPKDLKTGLFQITPQSLDPMTMSLRLRQVTADTSIVSDVIQSSSKLDMMEEIIEEELAPKDIKDKDNNEILGKVIIFSNWTTVTNIVRKRLAKYNPAYITGEVNDQDKNNARKRFQTDPNCRIIIGTIPAMGTGYTLDAATAVIFLDEPWTKAVKDQAEDRAHRASTTHSVNIYTMMAKDTVDEHVHEIVEQKGDVADLIVDGVVNPNKKMQMMKILIGADRWGKLKEVN